MSCIVFEESDDSPQERLENCSSSSRMKTQPMMIPQWFILMAKLLICQIRFQSARSCAKTGPRKENPFCLGQNFLNLRPDFIHKGPNHKKKVYDLLRKQCLKEQHH